MASPLRFHVHRWITFLEWSIPLPSHTFPTTFLKTEVQGAGSGYIINSSEFAGPNAHRVIMSSDGRHDTFGILRTILAIVHDPPASILRNPRYKTLDELTDILVDIPNPIIVTDGSVKPLPTLSDVITKQPPAITAGAGIVILSSNENWEDYPSIGVHIPLPSDYNSSFLSELAAMAWGMALRREVQTNYGSPIPMLTDSKSSISALQRRTKGSEVGYQLIQACQHQLNDSPTATLPVWIKSHPENYAKDFTPQQQGIFLADIYADGSKDTGCHSFTIPSGELSVLRNDSRLILTRGSELVVQDLRYLSANHHFQQYIQQRNQQTRHLYGNWENTTGKLAQELWRVSKLTPNRLGTAQRFCWDKYYHLSHPSLDPVTTVTPLEVSTILSALAQLPLCYNIGWLSFLPLTTRF